jgi:S-formylglutathione hydrolase FrmB
VQNYTFDLKIDAGKLNGTASAQIADEPRRDPVQIRDGKLDGNNISFVEILKFNDISRDFHDALVGMNIPHTWHVDAGGHTWAVWKNDLYLLSQMVFRN